jgi:hypothetical protein
VGALSHALEDMGWKQSIGQRTSPIFCATSLNTDSEFERKALVSKVSSHFLPDGIMSQISNFMLGRASDLQCDGLPAPFSQPDKSSKDTYQVYSTSRNYLASTAAHVHSLSFPEPNLELGKQSTNHVGVFENSGFGRKRIFREPRAWS